MLRLLRSYLLAELLALQREVAAGVVAVMDGTTAGNGPGPYALRPEMRNVILASADSIALDAVAARLIGFDPLHVAENTKAPPLAFAKLRQTYDFIIVDLPPLAPVVDVRSSTHLIDSFVFVVEWGATKIDVISHALHRTHVIQDRLLGVVLNKVDMSALGRFESNRGNYYHNKYYSRYGYVE